MGLNPVTFPKREGRRRACDTIQARAPLVLANLPTDPAVRKQSRLEDFLEHRTHLFSIAYRMLGSVTDAEDILQEAFLRWQEVKDPGIQSPSAFLVTIVTRLCINQLQSSRRKRESYVGEWLPEPVVTGAGADPSLAIQVDESLCLAFLVLLERLTPVERAVFLLREVFDYDYPEIAQILSYTETNCRQILRRARQHLGEQRPRFDASLQERERLLRQFVQAASTGDATGLVALLSNDVVFHSDGGGKAQALLRTVSGARNVAQLVANWFQKPIPGSKGKPAEINGQPGMLGYREGRLFNVLTVDIVDNRIAHLYVITNPEKLSRVLASSQQASA